MKKTAIVLLTFVAALTVVSCQREVLKEVETTPKGEGMTISAVSEGIGADVKAEMAYKYDILWKPGDKICVRNSEKSVEFTLTGGQGTTKGIFSSETSISGDVEGFYPASIVSGSNLVWPAVQSIEQTVPMYSRKTISEEGEQTFNFSSLGSVLQLMFSTSSSNVTIKSIEVKANKAMSGTFTISGGKAVVEQPAEGDKPGITLDLGEGTSLGVTAKKFNIAIPSGAYSDLTITFTAIDGRTCRMHSTKEQLFEYNTVGRLNISGEFKRSIPAGALTGKFSVSNTKQVRFSQGNLYWNGDSYEFENSQFSSQWDETYHVGLFFWSKDESVARDMSYSWNEASLSDVFFTNAEPQTAKPDFTVNGETGTFRTLSTDEWEYLLRKRKNAANLFKDDVTVCGVEHCLVIAPDVCVGNYVFNGAKTSYNASEWAAAESAGLVCFSPAGYRNNIYRSDEGSNGFYWTSTPSDNSKASSFGIQKIDAPKSEDVTVLNDTPSTGGMSGWGNGFNLVKETVDGVYCYHISTTTASNPWDVQFAYGFGSAFEVGAEYTLMIKAKASKNYSMGIELQHTAGGDYHSCGGFERISLSTGWQEINVSAVCSGAGATSLTFSIGDFVGDIYIENIVLVQKASPKLDFWDTPDNNALQGWGNFEKIIFRESESSNWYYILQTTAVGSNPWDTQFAYFFARPFKQGKKYTIKMRIFCVPVREINGNFQNSTSYASGGPISLGYAPSYFFQELYTVATCTSPDANSIVFNIGDMVGQLSLESFSVVEDDVPESVSIGADVNKRYFGFAVRLVCDAEKESAESEFGGGEILNY